MLTSATTIGRARVTGVAQAERSLATRLAVAGLLAGADLRPPGLPPAAVLIVNRLALPANRRLTVRSGARLDPAWERAARDALADLYRRAARPLHALPPPGCPAVLFSDEAELLACLALDIAAGRAAGRWWWQAVLRRWGSLTPGVLAAALAESPRAAPAALRILAEQGAAGQVLQLLTPGEAQQVLQAVCIAFDTPRLAWLAAPSHRPQPRVVPGSAPVQPVERARIAPPWQPFTPPRTQVAGLTPQSACLLGVALTLAHSPSVAQQAAFAEAMERWWQEETGPRRADDWPPASRAVQPTSLHPGEAYTLPGQPPVTSLLAAPAAPSAPQAAASDRQAAAELETQGARDFSELPTVSQVGSPDPASFAVIRLPAADHSSAARHGRSVSEADVGEQRPSAPVAPVAPPDGITTELGGVLFLLNLMQRLDLPACFEVDWQLASQVGPWGTLELAARGLLAQELPTFPQVGNSDVLAADPLWSALAAIAGRAPGVLPDGAVTVPERLRVPVGWARWLEAAGAGAAQRETASASPATTVAVSSPLDGPLLAGIRRDLRAWLAAVTPLLRTILARALGDEFDSASDLLLRRGQLYVTATRVDLVLPQSSVSMPVRIAGLDFDPGWIPAFGRVVQFHYE